MMSIRRSEERGHFDHGWLKSFHTFSFADYYDPQYMGFRALRVLNEDRVQPGGEFGMHPHRDMEIISYVMEGALSHRDSMGNGSTIYRGDVQRMTAGTGVLHSEANHSPIEPAHFFQIWLLPAQKRLEPEYEQRGFSDQDKLNTFCLIASPDGRHGSLRINQDVLFHASILNPPNSLEYILNSGRHAWVQIAQGTVKINGHQFSTGDGAAISEQQALQISAVEKSEFLLLDLA